jgi:hypothetical protein
VMRSFASTCEVLLCFLNSAACCLMVSITCKRHQPLWGIQHANT